MDESLKCECGETKFWYFGGYVRCPKCFNEMKETTTGREKVKEPWLRRFNNENNQYGNWEHMGVINMYKTIDKCLIQDSCMSFKTKKSVELEFDVYGTTVKGDFLESDGEHIRIKTTIDAVKENIGKTQTIHKSHLSDKRFIILTREDLVKYKTDLPIEEVGLFDFKSSSITREEINKAEVIIFKDGEQIIEKSKEVLDSIANKNNIHEMLKQFRQWNESWECLDKYNNHNKLITISEFVDKLSSEFKVTKKETLTDF